MASNKVSFIKFGALLLLALHINGCKERGNSKTLPNKDSLVVNCYVTKPVYGDSKVELLGDFDFTKETLNDFLGKVIAIRGMIKYDLSMDFVTNYSYQKEIVVNSNCFSKLSKPDSSNLINIYFNTGFATWVKKRSAVQYLKTYKKVIRNLGDVTIFEYRFNNVAEIEPHFMYIILKDQTENEKRNGKDYKGFVICSDGIGWKDYSDKGFSVPLFTKMIRRSKEVYIPLYYDGKRFIPIGHFKSNYWQE
jgi:hypothetical protein